MDEEGIGLVLARATELRMKINDCVQKVTTDTETPTTPLGLMEVTETQQEEDGNSGCTRKEEKEAEDEKTEDEDAEKLLNICDSLETLESQLSSLQDLQQKRRNERQVALAEIENSRKLLLDKLKKYSGKQLEVIGEASAFAGETVAHKDVTCVSEIQTAERHVKNGLSEPKKCLSQSEKNQARNRTSSSRKGLRYLAISATIVGVVTILSLSGLGSNFGKKGFRFNFMSMFRRETGGNSTIDCPQGKIQVMENGENLYPLKERMEVPVSAVSGKQYTNYGCG